MAAEGSVAEIADEIRRRYLPALFVDTCAAFDVMRCAARGKPAVAAAARQVIEAGTAEEILLYGASVLPQEAARNRVEVEGESRKEARRVDESMAAHKRIAAIVGVEYPYAESFNHESLVGHLIRLHDELLAACRLVVTEPDVGHRVLKRAGLRRRPARGGGGVNDCIMFEEFRSIALAVPTAPLILLTTNTNDFSEAGRPHPEIVEDLTGTAARVCLGWGEAAAAVLRQERLALIGA